jgi:hypothetical protein
MLRTNKKTFSSAEDEKAGWVLFAVPPRFVNQGFTHLSSRVWIQADEDCAVTGLPVLFYSSKDLNFFNRFARRRSAGGAEGAFSQWPLRLYQHLNRLLLLNGSIHLACIIPIFEGEVNNWRKQAGTRGMSVFMKRLWIKNLPGRDPLPPKETLLGLRPILSLLERPDPGAIFPSAQHFLR